MVTACSETIPGWRRSSSPGAVEEGIPDRLRGDPAVRELDDLLAGLVARSRCAAWRAGRPRPTASGLPPVQPSLILAARSWLCRQGRSAGVVALGGVAFPAAIQQGVGQRAQDRLGVLPADALERPPTVGDVDRLVADRAEVAGAVAEEELVDLVGTGGAGQAGDRRVGGRLVPVVHRRDERRRGLAAGGTADSSTGAIVQLPSRTSWACELLK